MKIIKKLSILLLFIGLVSLLYFSISKLPSRIVNINNDEELSEENISFNFDKLKEGLKGVIMGDSKYIDVLIFGIPGDGYIASSLADSIILARYVIDENKLFLISIPRDLWVSDDEESFKLNEVLKRNKVDLALDVVEKISGISVSNYGVIDLNITKEVIDWLGGVDIYLEEKAVDWVSGYTLETGVHHLSGEDAVWLIRNRNNEKGDFFREDNQHKVIESILGKFINLSNSRKVEFVRKFVLEPSLLQNINIDLTEAVPLIFEDNAEKIHIESVVFSPDKGFFEISQINTSNSSSTYISVVMPTSGFGNYSEIREYVQSIIGD